MVGLTQPAANLSIGGVQVLKLIKEVELVEVEEIIPYHNNPKEHPEEQVEKIASSIKNFGFTVPIVVDGDNEIISGHGRLLAAKKLGLDKIPVIKRSDLSDSQARALRLADNRVSESDWNMESLAVELEMLSDEDMDLMMTGFDNDEIGEIFDTRLDDEIHEDEYDLEEGLAEAEENPISKTGDLWLLGRHRIYCGDSLDRSAYETLLDGRQVDLVVTDPPYNVNYGDKANMLNEYTGGDRITDNIQNDNMSDSDFYKFLLDFYEVAYEKTKAGAAIYVFHADTEGINFRTAFRDAGWRLAQCIIWVKNTLVLGRQDYQWKHEPILYGWKPGAGHYWNGGRKQTTAWQDAPGVTVEKRGSTNIITLDLGLNTVQIKTDEFEIIDAGDDTDKSAWFFDKPVKNADHPTMKPVGINARAIKNSSKPDQLVLDPFGGSGSSLIACEQTGRQARLIDMMPKYVDVTVDRYISFVNSSENVFVVRDGKKIPYSELS